MENIKGAILAATFTAALFALAIWIGISTQPIYASSLQGNDYQATTTMAAVTGTFDGIELLKTGQGALAQVTITGANTGNIIFYDATTTDITKRTTSRATSTIVIADIAASVAAGTYTFDAEFSDGLLMVRASGIGPTSTVMWR